MLYFFDICVFSTSATVHHTQGAHSTLGCRYMRNIGRVTLREGAPQVEQAKRETSGCRVHGQVEKRVKSSLCLPPHVIHASCVTSHITPHVAPSPQLAVSLLLLPWTLVSRIPLTCSHMQDLNLNACSCTILPWARILKTAAPLLATNPRSSPIWYAPLLHLVLVSPFHTNNFLSLSCESCARACTRAPFRLISPPPPQWEGCRKGLPHPSTLPHVIMV